MQRNLTMRMRKQDTNNGGGTTVIRKGAAGFVVRNEAIRDVKKMAKPKTNNQGKMRVDIRHEQ